MADDDRTQSRDDSSPLGMGGVAIQGEQGATNFDEQRAIGIAANRDQAAVMGALMDEVTSQRLRVRMATPQPPHDPTNPRAPVCHGRAVDEWSDLYPLPTAPGWSAMSIEDATQLPEEYMSWYFFSVVIGRSAN